MQVLVFPLPPAAPGSVRLRKWLYPLSLTLYLLYEKMNLAITKASS